MIRWRDPVWLILACVLLAGAYLIPAPTTRLIGHSMGEAPTHLWVGWLFKNALLEGRNPFFHPGVTVFSDIWIYPLDMSNHLLRLLLGAVMGPILAYNLTALGLIALLGFATTLLAREMGAGSWPSVLAGVVAALHPGQLGFLLDGRIDSCTTGWAVLVIWAWLRLMRQRSLRSAVILALLTGALVLASPNLTYVTALMLSAGTGVALLGRHRSQLWRPLALFAPLSLLVVAPVLLTISWVEGESSQRLTWGQHHTPLPLVEVLPSTDPAEQMWQEADLLARQPRLTPWYENHEVLDRKYASNPAKTAIFNSTINPGARRFLWLIPLLLGLVGLLRRPWQTLPWLAGAAILFLFAQGDSSANAPPISLPFTDLVLHLRPSVLMHWLPMGRVFQNFGIFAPLSAVFLGIAAAMGLQAAARNRQGALLTSAALALCLLEVQFLGPVPLPLSSTEMTRPAGLVEAIHRCGDGASSTVPRSHRELMLQTWHHKQIVTPWNMARQSRVPPGQHRLYRMVTQEPPTEPLFAELERWGTDSVLLLPRLFPRQARADVRKLLDRTIGPPTWTGDGIAHYCLGGGT